MDSQEGSTNMTAKEYQEKGIRQREAGNYNDAIKDLIKATELDPLDASSFANLGYCRQLLKEYRRAIDNYNYAINLKNDDESFFNNRGCCLEELGLFSEAIKDYSRAISLNPKQTILFLNRAEVRMKIREYPLAISDYSRYLFTYPACADVYLKRGIANLRYARRNKAKADWTVAADLGNQEAASLLSEHFAQSVSYPLDETYSYHSLETTSDYQEERYSYRNNPYDSIFNTSYSSLDYLYTKAIKDCAGVKQIKSSNQIKDEINPKALEDLSIVITGKIPDMTRKQVESLVKEAGGVIKGSITSHTNLLIAGEDAGSKLKKAEARGIEIINKDQLMSRIKIESISELLIIWSKLSEEETLKKLRTEAVSTEILKLLAKCNSYVIRKATLLNQNTPLSTFANSGLYKDSSTRLWKFLLKKWGANN